MKSLANASILALGIAAGLSQSPSDKIDERRLIELATRHIENVQAFLGDDETASERPTQGGPLAGLQIGTLATSRLQPCSIVGVATGLTPIEEWRRMFPRKDER
jgi:hypothetical protein